jgi:uncharacterized membrane protein
MTTIEVFGVFVEHPIAIAAIVPVIILLLVFIRSGPKKKNKFWLFFSRTIIYALLLIALASPFTQKESVIEGDPFVKILIDNSSSFSLYDVDAGNRLAEKLEKVVNVEVVKIGDVERSAIGDEILENMEEHESMLLVTDGNNNFGASLGDVALHAARNNVTLNSLEVTALEKDSSIRIIGPNKVTTDVSNVFVVKIDNTMGDIGHKLVVKVDGEEIFNQVTKQQEYQFTRKFGQGYHTIEASIDGEDYYTENNFYYKTVKVIPKPRILFYTKTDSPMISLMNKLYAVDVVDNLDSLDDKYQALIINDIGIGDVERYVERIRGFVSDGNGLLVIGGLSSYEYGGYEDSNFESLLPITVGSAETSEEKINIVIVIDISGSTGTGFGGGSVGDVEKALALGAIDEISGNSLVGVVAFNTQAFVVSPLSPLKDKKDELSTQVKSLVDVGATYLPAGLQRGIEMIENAPGGKNLIIISDGISGGFGFAEQLAADAESKGIKMVSVNVGNNADDGGDIYGKGYMKAISRAGGGTFFNSNEAPQKIKVLFGDESQQENQAVYSLIVFDEGHFITEDLEISAGVTGFNQVIPKTASKVLIMTDSGRPIVSVWRFGLGRIASLSTDDGARFAGSLLGERGSALVSRTTNWVIGDPERNLERFVSADDGRINSSISIYVKSPEPPVDEDLVFYTAGENLYTTSVFADKLGFNEIYSAIYGVNYKAEYERVAINEELEKLVEKTGGRSFREDQLNDIIEAIKSQSKRTIEKKVYYRWILIIAALLLFLLEVMLRRISEYRQR